MSIEMVLMWGRYPTLFSYRLYSQLYSHYIWIGYQIYHLLYSLICQKLFSGPSIIFPIYWSSLMLISCGLPVQVECMRQVLGAGVLGWPRGMGWGGRWDGGSGWGTHVNPWLIHVNIWQKPLQYCKVISLQLIKIN